MAQSGAHYLSDVETLRGIIDAVPHPIFVKDSESRFVVVNDAMCRFMGRSYNDLVGKLDQDFVPLEQAQIYQENDRLVLQDGLTNENEEPFTDAHGQRRTIVTRKSRFLPTDGEALLVGCITDISDYRRAEEAIRHHAEHDHLTGLANRSLFAKQLDAALAQPQEPGSSAALLMIDLDGFKAINDTLGHAAGDNILVQTANALTDLLGEAAELARLGGDEFAVIQRVTAQPVAAISVASAVVHRLAQPTYVGKMRVAISGSVGVALASEARSGRDELLRHADAALYAAKKDGRNCWRMFDARLAASVAA